MSPAGSTVFTNRLAGEPSPYLRQHAHNPVDWHPWGEAAFARARAEHKPIFLSVGYSTCHWCHVMAHESFENPAIAQRLNRDFVPVKVDREERPDIDRIYMTYVQAATGQGGWPMSVWLTPDLKPYYGGTYFPPEDRGGRPGLATILDALARAWAEQRERLVAEGDRVAAALQQLAAGPSSRSQVPSSREPPAGRAGSGEGRQENPARGTPNPKLQTPNSKPVDEAALLAAAGGASARCLEQLAQGFDAAYGGFGGAPKFPRAAVFEFLFRTVGTADAARMAAFTLRRMAEGGMHDHVGGGFHRYSVDPEWFVPHFEKMLYDQAQLAIGYLQARQATGDERYAWVARDTLDYVLRDLANPAGGFHSAEDADSPVATGGGVESRETGSEGHSAEGAFYVWTRKEIEAALSEGAATPDATRASRPQEDAALFCAHFDVRDDGNVPAELDPHGDFRGRNILHQRQPLVETARQFGLDPEVASDRLQACLARLQAVRAQRPRPSLDDQIIAAWNGLMISALARAHQVLETGGRAPGWPAELGAPDRSVGASAVAEATPGAVHEAGGPAVRPYLNAAVRAAEFLQRELYDESTGTLFRSHRGRRGDVPGFAEDYACVIQGLLDLYEASFEIRWLQWAERLQAGMDELFRDAEGGGYFSTRADAPGIIARLQEDYDGAEPAPASVAVANLLRLDAMIGTPAGSGAPEAGFRRRALQCAGALRGRWEQVPLALPQLLAALGPAREPPRTVVLAGDPEADDFRALAAILHEQLRPATSLLAADGGEGQRWLAARRPEMAGMKPIAGRAAAYVCENFTCRPPVTNTDELRRLLG